MDLAQVRRRFDSERRVLARDGLVLEVLPAVSRLRTADGSRRAVIFSSLSECNAEAAITGEIEHHRGLGVGFEWKVFGHDGPADLLKRLEARGFEVGPCEAVLVCDLSDPPPWVGRVNESGVVRVERLEQVEVYREVVESAFGAADDGTVRELADSVRAGSRGHRGYLAYCGDEAVCAGRMYTHPESWFAGLYGGGTRPAFRGRGFYRALVAARARDAIEVGARYLMVDALPTSRPILEGLGFEWVTDTWPCEWRVGG